MGNNRDRMGFNRDRKGEFGISPTKTRILHWLYMGFFMAYPRQRNHEIEVMLNHPK
jgi:hypothetical protein